MSFCRWQGITIVIAVMAMMISFSQRLEAVDHAESLYNKGANNYHRLYDDPVFASQSDNWLRTIKQFQIVQRTYPTHYRAPASLYNTGRLYRSLFQIKKRRIFLDRSSLTFRKLIDDYPKSNLADDAQFLLAENYGRFEKNKHLAVLEYKNLLKWFPKSDFKTDAQKRIQLLQPPHKDLRIYAVEEKVSVPVEMTTVRYGGLNQADNDPERPPVKVMKIDYWTTVDWSRVVVNARSDVRYKYHVLEESVTHPQKRLVLDISHAYLPAGMQKKIAANDGLITEARIGQFDKQTVRVVLDMVSLDKIKVFHFKLPLQYKIVIDIQGQHDLTEFKSTTKPGRKIGSRAQDSVESEAKGSEPVSLSRVFGLKVKRVILDPGHGGKDPGASAFGLHEKDVTLGIAFWLKKIIEKNHPRIKVLMTRTRDQYVKLEARTAFANKNKGDLFISIHVNASPRPRIRGVETYYLNLTSDNEALALAAKENQTSLKSISDLQNILNDLLTNSKIQESSDLANNVQKSIVEMTTQSTYKLRDLGVKKAPFIVLLGAQMPSILVETGFLSNRAENDALRRDKYRQTLARGIYKGIKIQIN
ncbi:MAG: AMIN domain-containing protein [Deltaproteobacteria bacterium]|nr:AMIN domain-containing protein [Deltaproteobacteria bacterium]MBT4640647.1 AMIN domain-containing protein [Deltaproteobacteria bacterium]MBT6505074.1 AMIN domain-containing protein [Deltaproteobacteria bacterium]MBT6615168.1 AMIN domain-containing protein [Deltaproteobacteria bacterium]MBT7716554.1 AMIN domain-containing protein [Deltaproteobacteria bacterium]